MSHVLLIIDSREKNGSKRTDLVDLWKAKQDANYTIAMYPLDVGDVWIYESSAPILVPSKFLLQGIASAESDVFPPTDIQPKIVVERKALADLQSSYADGRYQNQKMRLINCESPNVILLVEGYASARVKDATSKKRLLSTFTHCMFRDGINVYHTVCLQDTFDWIDWTCQEMALGKLNCSTEQRKRTKYTDSVKMNKKANLTPAKGLEMQLATIPGISTKMARVVVAKYPTMMKLCAAYTQVEKPTNLLTNMMINNKRKIGPKNSEKIYQFLNGGSV